MKSCTDERISTIASIVVLGMFDGVHIGHRVLIAKARTLAKQYHLPLIVQTFAQHPLSVLAPERTPSLLMTPQERAAVMEKLGVDIFCAQPFTEELRDMPPEVFVGELVRRWHPKAIIVGSNYTFGKGGEGKPPLLQMLGQALGFDTIVVPLIQLDKQVVSATEIRAALSRGDVAQARAMLGDMYRLNAHITKEHGEYRTLRVDHDEKQSVCSGDYRALIDDGIHVYPALARVMDEQTIICRLPAECLLEDAVVLYFRSEAQSIGAGKL